jgi:hypothetical protein
MASAVEPPELKRFNKAPAAMRDWATSKLGGGEGGVINK